MFDATTDIDRTFSKDVPFSEIADQLDWINEHLQRRRAEIHSHIANANRGGLDSWEMIGGPEDDEMYDNYLIRQHLVGVPNAFPEIIERYREPLIRFVHRVFDDHAKAEDVVHKTFVKARRKLASFDPAKMTFRQWVYTIAAKYGRQ